MEITIGILLLMVWLSWDDQSPRVGYSRSDARRYDCERLDPVSGSQRYPGRIAPPPPRATPDEQAGSVLCRERMLRPGLRAARDEAILSTLEDRTAGLASQAHSRRPDLRERTWLVEVFYPNSAVSAKIDFAAKNALSQAGLAVSDRAPVLGFGDIDVITRMAPAEAYPVACQRYHDTGSLGESDALLAVLVRDPRETLLHAGLCDKGHWTWLQ